MVYRQEEQSTRLIVEGGVFQMRTAEEETREGKGSSPESERQESQ